MSGAAMSGGAMITLRGVSKVYTLGGAEVRALDGVDLDVDEGELVAIMGPSGSGKSTLMNVIGCLDRPDTGEYHLDGHRVSGLSRSALADVRNRLVGFVFQSFNLLARTSAIENVELPLVYAGVGGRARRERALQALARVGLAERVHHQPSQLSGGQQQRVAIARALVNAPRLLLGDEPTGALDSRTRLDVLALLQSLWRGGQTIVLVTHDPELAEFTSRVLVMRDGKLVSDKRQTPRLVTAEVAA